MPKKKLRFGEYLVSQSLVTQEQLDMAIAKQQTTMGHRKVGEILVRYNCIERLQKDRALAKHLKVRMGDHLTPKHLWKIPRPQIDPDFSVIGRLYKVVPVATRPGGRLCLATTDPSTTWRDSLERIIGLPLSFMYVPQSVFEVLFQARFGESFQKEDSSPILGKAPHPFSFLASPMRSL